MKMGMGQVQSNPEAKGNQCQVFDLHSNVSEARAGEAQDSPESYLGKLRDLEQAMAVTGWRQGFGVTDLEAHSAEMFSCLVATWKTLPAVAEDFFIF